VRRVCRPGRSRFKTTRPGLQAWWKLLVTLAVIGLLLALGLRVGG